VLTPSPELHTNSDFGLCIMNALNIKRGFWRKWADISANVGRTPLGSTPDTTAYASSTAGYGGAPHSGGGSGSGTEASAYISRISSDSPHSLSGIPTSGTSGSVGGGGGPGNNGTPFSNGTSPDVGCFNIKNNKGTFKESVTESPESVPVSSLDPRNYPPPMPGMTYMETDLGRRYPIPMAYNAQQTSYAQSTPVNTTSKGGAAVTGVNGNGGQTNGNDDGQPGRGLSKEMETFFDKKLMFAHAPSANGYGTAQ